VLVLDRFDGRRWSSLAAPDLRTSSKHALFLNLCAPRAHRRARALGGGTRSARKAAVDGKAFLLAAGPAARIRPVVIWHARDTMM
jgi:hypothetical protein